MPRFTLVPNRSERSLTSERPLTPEQPLTPERPLASDLELTPWRLLAFDWLLMPDLTL